MKFEKPISQKSQKWNASWSKIYPVWAKMKATNNWLTLYFWPLLDEKRGSRNSPNNQQAVQLLGRSWNRPIWSHSMRTHRAGERRSVEGNWIPNFVIQTLFGWLWLRPLRTEFNKRREGYTGRRRKRADGHGKGRKEKRASAERHMGEKGRGYQQREMHQSIVNGEKGSQTEEKNYNFLCF